MDKLTDIQWGWELICTDRLYKIDLYESIYQRGSYKALYEGSEYFLKSGDSVSVNGSESYMTFQSIEIKDGIIMINFDISEFSVTDITELDIIIEIPLGYMANKGYINISELIVDELLMDQKIWIDMEFTEEQKINILDINIEELSSNGVDLIAVNYETYNFWIEHLVNDEKYEECQLLEDNKMGIIN